MPDSTTLSLIDRISDIPLKAARASLAEEKRILKN